jgi:CRISPR-associated protein Cmr3
MTFWIIEPRDPLIVRDGRPFGPNPGARATTMPFPFPSTLVGALRHKAGLDINSQFEKTQITTVLMQGMRGPLLIELDDNDKISNWLLPAPADALLLEPPKASEDDDDKSPTAQRFWMQPAEKATAITNMPDDLAPVGPAGRHPEKVSTDIPRFWYRNELYAWLKAPTEGDQLLDEIGIRGLEINTRMHVSIQPDQQTAIEGALFQTSGLEFTWRNWQQAKQHHFETKRLALAVWFDGATPNFTNNFAPLGGERRLMRWDSSQSDKQPFPAKQRDDIFTQIEKDKRCRVLLLTPAYFASKRNDGSEIVDGYRPPLKWTRGGVTATLKAAAVSRTLTISGWDLAANNGRGEPKPTRRLAPAGSVYFVEFPDGADVRKWLDKTWMDNISDDAQSCLDGFGLAVVGVWPKK